MKTKFTYLLGAGASVKTIPIVSKFNHGLIEFRNDVKSSLNSSTLINEFDSILKSLDEVINDLPSYASFDTLAKKLMLTGEKIKLKEYKNIIATYIHYSQLIKNIDLRYELFFSSLIEYKNGIKYIPDNISFISWNYDRLIERSLINLLGTELSDLNNHINIFSNYKSNFKPDRLNLIKLNGSAGEYLDYEKNTKSRLNNARQSVFEDILKYYSYLNTSQYQKERISFSWEDDNEEIKRTREIALKTAEETDILIVIGYSFPTFNRKLDSQILRSMKKLSRVYIQSPKETIDGVMQRFIALSNRSENIELIKEVDEFYIPYEFNDIYPEKEIPVIA